MADSKSLRRCWIWDMTLSHILRTVIQREKKRTE